MKRLNPISKEVLNDSHLSKRFKVRWKIIKQLERVCGFYKPSTEILRREYDKVCEDLNCKFPLNRLRTSAEQIFFKRVQQQTKLKFIQSIWIGNRNIDLFCGSLGSAPNLIQKGNQSCTLMRGLAVEIDGPIHDQSLKLKKDQNKYDFIHSLGIGLVVIENKDLGEITVLNLLRDLKRTPRLDSRAKKRLWRKIYLSTIAYHAKNEILIELYGQPYSEFLKRGCHV